MMKDFYNKNQKELKDIEMNIFTQQVESTVMFSYKDNHYSYGHTFKIPTLTRKIP